MCILFGIFSFQTLSLFASIYWYELLSSLFFFYHFFFVLFFIVLRVAFYTIFLHSNFTKKKDFIGKAILVLGINISFSLQVRLLDLEGCFISSAMSEFILELLMRTLGSVIQLESCINKLPDFWHFTKGPFMNCQNQYLYKTENSFSLNCFQILYYMSLLNSNLLMEWLPKVKC